MKINSRMQPSGVELRVATDASGSIFLPHVPRKHPLAIPTCQFFGRGFIRAPVDHLRDYRKCVSNLFAMPSAIVLICWNNSLAWRGMIFCRVSFMSISKPFGTSVSLASVARVSSCIYVPRFPDGSEWVHSCHNDPGTHTCLASRIPAAGQP